MLWLGIKFLLFNKISFSSCSRIATPAGASLVEAPILSDLQTVLSCFVALGWDAFDLSLNLKVISSSALLLFFVELGTWIQHFIFRFRLFRHFLLYSDPVYSDTPFEVTRLAYLARFALPNPRPLSPIAWRLLGTCM